MTRVHYAVETDMVTWDGFAPACGNDFRHTKKLTEDEREVTCPRCLRALGIEAAEPDALTVVESDPFKGRLAA